MKADTRHITILLGVTALLAFLLSFIAPVAQQNDERQVAKVERHLLKKQKVMDRYVHMVQEMPVDEWIELPGFPDDMVLYRYNADTLQSWVNEFSISNDEVDVAPLWYRLHFMSNDNLYNTPLAYITGKDSYVNLGLSWYVVRAYTSGPTKIITGIRIKDEYPSDNMEIISRVNPTLGFGKGFTSSTLDMNNGLFVRGDDGSPLFSIVPASASSIIYRDYTLRFISLLLILLAVFYYHYSKRSRTSFIVTLALLTLTTVYALYLFGKVDTDSKFVSPLLYADAGWFNSFAHMLATHLYIILVIAAVFLMRNTLYRKILSLSGKERLFIGCAFALATVLFALYIHFTFRSLIQNSSIVLDLYRITELSAYSIISYLVYALLFLTLLFMVQVTLTILGWQDKIKVTTLKGIVIYSAIAAVYTVLTVANVGKDKENRTNMVRTNRMAVERDLSLEIQLRNIENPIASDQLIGMLSYWPDGGTDVIRSRILERYLYSNFSQKYDIAVTTCESNSKLLIDQYTQVVDCYDFYSDEISRYGVQLAPTSRFFYMSNYYGKTVYIGVFTYMNYQSYQTARLYIEIVRKAQSGTFVYPEGMMTSDNPNTSIPEQYSYAKYASGKLASSSGAFIYPSKNPYEDLSTGYHVIRGNGYTHFVNKLSDDDVIVLSRAVAPLYSLLVSLSYVFLLFCALNMICTHRMRRRSLFNLPAHSFKRKITFLIVISLASALICVGVGTIFYTLSRSKASNEEQMQGKMNIVQSTLSEFCQYALRYSDLNINQMYEAMQRVAGNTQSDINLYDTHGSLIRSTKPELFEQFIMGSRMNHDAFYNIVKKDATRYIAEETIAGNKYLSIYAPLFNVDGSLVAVANIPYISTQSELQADALQSVATIVNIYLLILIAGLIIGLMFANSISRPLTEIKGKMESLTIDGIRKEHINYRNTKDELGVLVQAYNNMVDDLEESTRRLAETEREQAWKEMARQIAHEIKNPLTPMRLSIQHMMRLKKQNVPGWEDRFEELSRSLLEQIDILSETANEFSQFSKFYSEDETVENLDELLSEQVVLFSGRDDVTVTYRCNVEQPMVRVRKKQIIRAFVNLISNAVQAVEQSSGGLVRITVDYAGGGEYSVAIEDNGPGVSPENRNKLFKPNFTTKTSGTGLGLAITRSIVEQSSGRIFYRTSELGGAAFIIVLPEFINR
ncbi:MAG: cache domain-containing protein [Bacteroidales bacterium]|nr:cache domain-containing protein [Bacteroidales bacterium]